MTGHDSAEVFCAQASTHEKQDLRMPILSTFRVEDQKEKEAGCFVCERATQNWKSCQFSITNS